MKINPKKIEEVLTRGVDKIMPSRKGFEKLMKKRRIRVYLGIDPTASRLHLGHTITLRKLQEFADLGQEAILVIGTGTVLTGDPSLRLNARPVITEKEIKRNIKTWKKQAAKVLDFSKVKIRYNGRWLLKLKYKDIVKIASNISAIKLLQRDMFQRRLKAGQTVWSHELLYPLFQGYDSVFLDVDLEIGGTDQTFNMLMGRELMAKMRQKEKFVLTCPMILGTDGKQMSKTSGNCVWLEDGPSQMYGKLMSIPDELIFSYFKLLTRLPLAEIKKIKKTKPMEAKTRLAYEIVSYYHGKKAGKKAENEFEKIFREKKLPSKMPEIKIKAGATNILELLVKTDLTSSKSQAKRLILQKGIKINGEIQEDWKKVVQVKKKMVLQAGKRKFLRIK